MIRARWLLTGFGPAIEHGAVRIHDARIVEVGRFPGEPALDLGEAILLPALVNAHTHLEFSDLPRPLGSKGDSLPNWIRFVIAQRSRGGRQIQESIAAGQTESLRWGVAALGDIATAPPSAYGHANASPLIASFQEVIGFSGARAESALGHVLAKRSEAHAVSGAHPVIGVSPHAPYTVHPRLLAGVVAAAQECSFPVAMHLAESREELEFLEEGKGPFRDLLEERSMWDNAAIAIGSRPLDYLRVLAEAPRALIVHGNYLAPDEIVWIGQRSATMAAIHCPRTHAYFGHDRYPLPQMLAAGACVALGTDSRASSPDLDLLAELRLAGAIFPEIAPERLLRMATSDAAAALGMGDAYGLLAAGRRADMLELQSKERIDDPYEAVVRDADLERRVWQAGARNS